MSNIVALMIGAMIGYFVCALMHMAGDREE